MPRRAGVVDPRAVAAHLAAVHRFARRALDGDDRQRLELVDLVRQPPQRARRALGQQPVADARLDEVRELLAAEYGVLAALPTSVVLSTTLPARSGLRERLVGVGVVRLLGELDVVDDHLRLVGRHAVEGARERPAPELPALSELVERHVIDAHHDDVVRYRPLAPELEARVDRGELGAVERAGGVEQQDGAEREQRHRRQERPAQAASGRTASHGLKLTDLGAKGPGLLRLARSWPRRVALVHDFLLDLRGAERVFAAICDAWPDADVFTAVYDERGTEGRFADRNVHTSFLQRLRPTARTFRPLLPLYPHAVESFDLRGYDTVISSSSAWAHGVLVDPGAVHVCYCHNPFRYAWTEREATLGRAARSCARRCGCCSRVAPVGLDRRPARRPLRRQLAHHRRARAPLPRARVDGPAPAGGDRPLHAGPRPATTTSCSPS